MKSLFIVLIISIISPFVFAQNPQYPIVKGFGGIYKIQNVEELPKSDIKYKVVIDVKGGDTTSEGLNASLNNIARMLNLHGLGGVKAKNIEVIAILHAKATSSILSDEAYQKEFQKDNPNKDLVKVLSKNNVKFLVCGQSLLARGYQDNTLLPEVAISISALSVLTTYQLDGYALLTF